MCNDTNAGFEPKRQGGEVDEEGDDENKDHDDCDKTVDGPDADSGDDTDGNIDGDSMATGIGFQVPDDGWRPHL